MYAGWIPSISHTLSLSITLSRCHYITLTLFNFETQLNQSSLLLICNYYVFSIVTDFVLQQIEQLKCLISMLGGFYTAKSSLHCNCKFIKINGLFDTLKKTQHMWHAVGTNMEDHFVECGCCKRLY